MFGYAFVNDLSAVRMKWTVIMAASRITDQSHVLSYFNFHFQHLPGSDLHFKS